MIFRTLRTAGAGLGACGGPTSTHNVRTITYAPYRTQIPFVAPQHRNHGEREGRNRRPVRPRNYFHYTTITTHPTATGIIPGLLTDIIPLQLRPSQVLRHKPHYQSQRPRERADLRRKGRRERSVYWRKPSVRIVRIREE